MGSATKLVEVAITEETALGLDRYSDDLVAEDANQLVSVQRVFHDEKWSRGRPVTSLDWSPKFPELVLGSYSSRETTTNEAEGVCLVWNLKYKRETPEYVFTSESPLVTARFSMFHPNLIVGGAYSGQIMLWDNRTNKRSPVQRSRFSPTAHTLPVYCAQVVGVANSNSLVTASTDGKLCSWSLDMLTEPTQVMELEYSKSSGGTKAAALPVSPICIDFQENDPNNFIVGCEAGAVYTASRHGAKSGIQDQFRGHDAPVTGVSCHDSSGSIDFSDLFLSSSMDWTVKLWSARERKELYSFEASGDYVMDVAWSPVHTALFASVEAGGSVQLWDLNSNTEMPAAVCKPDKVNCLNKVSWSSTGLNIATGDENGQLVVLDVSERLANPSGDASANLTHSLQEMQANKDV